MSRLYKNLFVSLFFQIGITSNPLPITNYQLPITNYPNPDKNKIDCSLNRDTVDNNPSGFKLVF
ncbi:hypothetical protein BC008_34400 [Mastigocoleus testarum BC008]|uniref:Uncharacterized protein n=1 Tax=Mastigocoleus testarum BC008 TaxID=371196 RepID=A0A0V7ZUH0_9CYAN|nr:hypothetical protein BC008_32715 [Mastigocoleus testarum BC008]KST68848.1 hypothetical protein BC008_34400 [Mastigocoleus testarum BC008]